VDITIRQNSLQVIALVVVAAAGLWLVGVAFLMALRPRYCLHLFEKMSADLLERSNWRLQFTEGIARAGWCGVDRAGTGF
jgi:hypothetical protein